MTSEKRPLVTFLMVACNFEKFIRESVEAAFAQTYSPLEIILSDDCSQDRTYEIMHKMASEYRGPHLVRLNRFNTRRGLGAHISHVFEMAGGQFHVVSSGDDVSLPERTEVMVRTWEATEKRANLIYSRFILIDENGKNLGGDHGNSTPVWNSLLKNGSNCFDFCGQPVNWVRHKPDALDFAARRVEVKASGCANAYSAHLFRTFGPLLPDLVLEDQALVFRSLLLGDIVFLDRPLVKYRRHGLNLSTQITEEDDVRCRLQVCERNMTVFKQFALDIKRAAGLGIVPQPLFRRIDRELVRQQQIYEVKCKCVTATPWRIPDLTCQLLLSGAGPRTLAVELGRLLRRPL